MRLGAFGDKGLLNVIIETPKGSHNKFDYEPTRRLFCLHKVLPPGSVFPYDFGFVPSTLAEDGDPLDVLVLMEEPAFPGCHVKARLVGVIEAEQIEDGETIRNDRLIAVAHQTHTYADVQGLSDLPAELVEGIEHFFVSYNELSGKKFKPLGRRGPARARKVVREAERKACKERPAGYGKLKKAARA
jgi:inorganic pyrophosphatase